MGPVLQLVLADHADSLKDDPVLHNTMVESVFEALEIS